MAQESHICEVQLALPGAIGSVVFSSPQTADGLQELGLRVMSLGDNGATPGSHHDLGALTTTLVGSVVGAAAVKGLFDLLQTIVREACAFRRQQLTHKQELEKARLVLNGSERLIELDKPEVAQRQLQALLRAVQESYEA